jgi:glycerophosphoryl diester phosphodiesterase
MMSPKWIKRTAVLLALLFFAFTLLHASWFAKDPMGEPKLIADRAAEPVRDTAGCVSTANAGHGGFFSGPDIAALQTAAGAKADGIRVGVERVDGVMVVKPQFESKCPADAQRRRASAGEAFAAISRPVIFWEVKGADNPAQMLGWLSPLERNAFIGDEAAVKAIKAAHPKAWAFSVAGARACAADYKASLTGAVPESCRGGTMLLTLGDLGFTLWGWPNRFLERMKAADVRVIIAEDLVAGKVKGLTDVHQYGDIADSYNGYIWIDDIESLGPALKR